MLYICFLNLQNPLQDVEQLYKDGTIKPGDIVCQQYNNKYSHLFMNGTWVKTKYTSKIAQNTEVEDDVKTLYDSIANNSTNISNISTNLSDNYINKTDYQTDKSSTDKVLSELNNKIDSSLEDLQYKIEQLSTDQQNYMTTAQYIEDEELIASTFANVNNKINSLYAEISKLKEQLNNKA